MMISLIGVGLPAFPLGALDAISVVLAISGLALGVIGAVIVGKLLAKQGRARAREDAEAITAGAKKEAEAIKKEAALEAKAEFLKRREEFEEQTSHLREKAAPASHANGVIESGNQIAIGGVCPPVQVISLRYVATHGQPWNPLKMAWHRDPARTVVIDVANLHEPAV